MRKAPLLLAISCARGRRFAAHAAISFVLAQGLGGDALAGDDGAVVARVGTRAITTRELVRRMAAVPPFQLRTFGKDNAEIKRNFLEKVLVREELLAQAAEDRKLAEREDVRDRIRGILRGAIVTAERTGAATERPVTDADIQAYYQANANKFHAPSRVSVWRIQVGTEKEAVDVLEEMKKDESTKHWTELARERSLDKATYMRGGNLGFVGPDGSTTEEGVKIEPSALAAIARVKDTVIVPEPVKEGDRFDVLWRRQSMRAVERPLDLERVPIKQVLMHQRTEERLHALVDKLRKEHVTDFHPEELDGLDVEPGGDLALQRRPGALGVRHAAAAAPAPKAGPAGMR